MSRVCYSAAGSLGADLGGCNARLDSGHIHLCCLVWAPCVASFSPCTRMANLKLMTSKQQHTCKEIKEQIPSDIFLYLKYEDGGFVWISHSCCFNRVIKEAGRDAESDLWSLKNHKALIPEPLRMYGTKRACARECILSSECQKTHPLANIFFQYKQKPLCLSPPC